MAQRFQGFISMANPTKNIAKKLKNKNLFLDNMKEYVDLKNEVKAFAGMYGEKANIIVAFHHQWLYGRSALLSALTILEVNKGLDESRNFFSKNYSSYGCDDSINDFKAPIKHLFNFLKYKTDGLSKHTRISIENYTNLNEDEGGIDFTKDFTIGDNNDGIYIVDTKTNKYCFMNIDDTNDLPKMKPLTASEYVKSYYPETVEKNKEINAEFIERFKEFKVLTMDEVIQLFPEMESRLKNAAKTDVETISLEEVN